MKWRPCVVTSTLWQVAPVAVCIPKMGRNNFQDTKSNLLRRTFLVGGFNPSEKYESQPNIWKNKKWSKPPTRFKCTDGTGVSMCFIVPPLWSGPPSAHLNVVAVNFIRQYIYIYVCVSYNMSTFYAQHKISTLHLIPSPASAPVVPRASLPTSRWPGVFGTPKTHGLPSVSDGFLLLLKWLAMSEGNCLCSGFCLIYYQFPPL